MNHKEARTFIQETSESYLAQNPPVGVRATLAGMLVKYIPVKFVEFRKPFVRIPDELDERQTCYLCGGDETVWSPEDQAEVYCPQCGGDGTIPFKDNEVFLTVYRDGHSIETLAVVTPDAVNAWVSVSEPGFPKGMKVELTDDEADLARCATQSRKK